MKSIYFPNYTYTDHPTNRTIVVLNKKTGHTFNMNFTKLEDLYVFMGYRTRRYRRPQEAPHD
jgi:hypothetical protein